LELVVPLHPDNISQSEPSNITCMINIHGRFITAMPPQNIAMAR
jgi:hypothetical protein